MSRTRILSLAIVALSAAAIWFIFRPALMSPDSMTQYEEALAGKFADRHPPAIAVTLSWFLRLGAGLDGFMFLQCALCSFGIFLLARETAGGPLAGLVVFLILIATPPLAFYLMTLWKDMWFITALTWTCFLLKKSLRTGTGVLPIILISAIGSLGRYNAVVVLPVIGFAAWIFTGATRKRLVILLLPLLIFIAARTTVNRIHAIEPTEKTLALKAYDLAGICSVFPEVAEKIPYSRDVVAPYFHHDGYFFDALFMFDYGVRLDTDRVHADYRTVLREEPLRLAAVKLAAFSSMVISQNEDWWFQESLIENNHGLRQGAATAGIRAALIDSAKSMVQSPPLLVLLASHRIWFALALGFLFGSLALFAKTRDQKWRNASILALIPVMYYLSYLVSAPSRDFRYMYPATLLTQIFSLSILVRLIASWLESRANRRRRG